MTTDISDSVQIEFCRRILKEREEKRRKQRELERENLICRVKEAIQQVAPSFPVEKVFLYGSILTGHWRPDSDIDIVVEGRLSPEEFFALWRELDRRLDEKVDLRELEKLPFRERVKSRGVILYERKNSSSFA